MTNKSDSNTDIDTISYLSDAKFRLVFDHFSKLIERESGEPFKDFGSGLPSSWEGYKEWIYHEGRRVLDFNNWKRSKIGSGEILNATIGAIELHSSKEYRNNLVQWDARYGEKNRSHKALLQAVGSTDSTYIIEKVLHGLFKGKQSSDGKTFEKLVELLGKRYDLLAYLYFLKDWTRYMPIKTDTFTKSFGYLGMPYHMANRCSWDNYQGYLSRLILVQQKLSEYQVPGNRLIDAHSFCWILGRLWDGKTRTTKAIWVDSKPKAAGLSALPKKGISRTLEKTGEDYLKEAHSKQLLGTQAEDIVYEAEVKRLKQKGKKELADKVKKVSANPTLGYDIESFQVDGSPKRIEVKAVSATESYWRFYISQNELDMSEVLDGYIFALVDRVHSTKPHIWEFPGKQLPKSSLKPENYKAYLKAP